MMSKKRDKYEQSLIQYRDLKSALETAVEEKVLEIVENAISKGLDNEFITELTGLNIEAVEKIRQQYSRNT